MQAAGGASLSDAHETQGSAGPAHLRLLFLPVAVLCLALDQITKALAVAKLVPGEPHDLVGDALRLDLTRNSGAAFSTGTGHTEWFSALAIIATVVVVWFAVRARSLLWTIALGVLLAGIDGNLIDRIVRPPSPFRGAVVDFLDIQKVIPGWGIFNLADVCITVAAVLIVIQAVRGVRLNGTRAARDE